MNTFLNITDEIHKYLKNSQFYDAMYLIEHNI